MKEFEIIKKYFSSLSNNNPASLYLNDDVFFDRSKKLVISVDTYVEGNHFLDFRNPDLVIKKILRSSISDLICKGVKPQYYFISGSGNKKSFSKKNFSFILFCFYLPSPIAQLNYKLLTPWVICTAFVPFDARINFFF